MSDEQEVNGPPLPPHFPTDMHCRSQAWAAEPCQRGRGPRSPGRARSSRFCSSGENHADAPGTPRQPCSSPRSLRVPSPRRGLREGPHAGVTGTPRPTNGTKHAAGGQCRGLREWLARPAHAPRRCYGLRGTPLQTICLLQF